MLSAATLQTTASRANQSEEGRRISTALDRYAAKGPPERYRQPGVGGLPVFQGAPAAVRDREAGRSSLIVYCDAERVVALVYHCANGRLQQGVDALPSTAHAPGSTMKSRR